MRWQTAQRGEFFFQGEKQANKQNTPQTTPQRIFKLGVSQDCNMFGLLAIFVQVWDTER